MAINNLQSVSIGDGDPVTADMLRKIIENINVIAKGDSTTSVQVVADKTVNGGTAVVSRGLNTTIGGIQQLALSPTMKSFPVPFGVVFDGVPTVNLNISFATTSTNAAYTPYVIAPSTTGFSIWCKAATTTTKSLPTEAKIHWTASGNIAG